MSKVRTAGYILASMGTCFVWALATELGDFVILYLLTVAGTLLLVLAFLALIEEREVRE